MKLTIHAWDYWLKAFRIQARVACFLATQTPSPMHSVVYLVYNMNALSSSLTYLALRTLLRHYFRPALDLLPLVEGGPVLNRPQDLHQDQVMMTG